MLQDIEKMKVQYLMSLLFDLFEILLMLEVNKRISLGFKFRCYGNSNENNKPLFKTKDYCFPTIRRVYHPFFFKTWYYLQ